MEDRSSSINVVFLLNFGDTASVEIISLLDLPGRTSIKFMTVKAAGLK